MESYKQEKIIIIMYEYLNDKREFYPISNVPLDKAKFFYKDDDGLFKLMAVSDYTVKTELNENRLYIVNAAIKDNSEKFQIGYEINFKAAEYESPLPVLSVLTKMYNQLIEDTRILHSYIRKQCFVADGKEQALVLPGLPAHTVWCMGENGKMFALPVSELYERFGNLIKAMEKVLDEYIEQKKEEIRGPAGAIDNVTASVNSNAGTPKVTVSLGGTPERRKIDLKFENLKGDKPIKGTDYYTEEEKQQFTTETLSLVTAEGNKQISLTQAEALKVIEQLKKLIEGNPETSNAQALSGKTRVEFEQDTENVENVFSSYVKQNSTINSKRVNVAILEKKMLTDKGVIITSESKDNTITDYFEVIPGESIFITGFYDLVSRLVAFYDKDKKFISQFPDKNIANSEVAKNKEFVVPLNARYAVVGSIYGYKISFSKKENITETLTTINNELEYNKYLSEHTFKIGNFSNVTNDYGITTGHYIDRTSGEPTKAETLSNTTDFIDINNLKDLYITANSQFATTIFALYDENFNFLKSHSNDSELKEFKKKEIIEEEIRKLEPRTKYIRFSSYTIPLVIEKLNRKTTEAVYDDIIKKIESSDIANLGEYQEASYSLQSGYINHDGEFASSSGNYSTDYIDINSFNELFVNGQVLHSSCFYSIYDNSKSFIKSFGKDLGVLKLEKISSSEILKENPKAKYIRISTVYRKLEIYSIRRYTRDETYERILQTNVLYNKKFAVCGDSFTEGIFNFEGGKENPDLYDKANQSWKNWGWWIAHRNMMNFVNDGVSGSTMALSKEYIDGTNSDINYRSPFSNERYKKIPKDCDYILISFGLNESSTPIGTLQDTTNRTILGAWNIVLEYFLTNMPYAKIGIIIQDAWLSKELTTALKNVSEYWGIPYLELKTDPKVPMGISGRIDLNVNPKATELRNKAFQISTSDSHPNPKAHKYRSTFIENFLRSL